MAQSVVHNFRRMSMADLKPREPGYILYKEGWHEWDGRGKQEEEAFAGHTLGCIRLMVTDNNIEPFLWQDWGPIEHFAAQGVIKDSIWTARIFFFLRLPIGQYGPVSQLSRSEESCTGPFNWGEAHCAGEKVKRKIGPFLRKSLENKTRTRTQQKGRSPPRQPGTPRPGSQVHGP